MVVSDHPTRHPNPISSPLLFLLSSSFLWISIEGSSAELPVDDLLLSSSPHAGNKGGMSEEKEDEGGKTAMAVDNQWIKRDVQGRGKDE